MSGAGGGEGELALNGDRVSNSQDEELPEVDGGVVDRMCFTPLNCTRDNSQSGKFYDMYISPQ